MAQPKTNAMRMLDKAKVNYTFHEYDHSDGAIDGVAVAAKLGQDPARVFKTLVTQGASRAFYVFVIPVAEELDLKAAARAVGEKSVAMLHVADLLKTTGYVRGGCSPVGMKKRFRTFIDGSAESFDTIFVSAGKGPGGACTRRSAGRHRREIRRHHRRESMTTKRFDW